MTDDTETLIQRWILRFCEMPILIDPELMRRVLADAEVKTREPRGRTDA
jgi:hypothetical protein